MKHAAAPTASASLIRREVAGLPRYDPGADPAEVAALSRSSRIIKLSNNESPFGISPAVAEAIRLGLADGVSRYPDPTGRRLAEAIGTSLDVPAERVVLGNGSENILELLCQAVLDPGDLVVTQAPGFSLHETFPRVMGARVEKVPVTGEFGFDAEAWSTALAAGPKLVFLANPCNPTGAVLSTGQLEHVLAATPASALLVLDEAYGEFARLDPEYPDALEALRGQDRPWIVLRTFSKAYGLAGVRVGYGVASDPTLVQALDRVRTPYNVNHPAQEAAIAALGDHAHLADTVRRTALEISRVTGRLEQAGLRVVPSSTNFLFIDTGRPSDRVAHELHRAGIIVKAWREPGYETYIRASLSTPEDNDVFIRSLTAICVKDKP
ncbi:MULTISPECIES: histidinol-phosphate transaminase [Streptomyces]|uniref:Histidinol-phosphate aminotransferase n=1 Tax=Streptomyces amritsarensis TaxID=681158 RepID=A0ABX3FU04_9ACTN|nr:MULTISPECIES: histidinol-phosphate transaminase [Streptomyces]AQT75705.1 histidinol-phosphate transaminase [Streptomyces sp. fd1-xmd]OLZ51177.1 histidinol-phosphate transaminase [Streptomyces amritsarensis]